MSELAEKVKRMQVDLDHLEEKHSLLIVNFFIIGLGKRGKVEDEFFV